jgi:cytochrome c-type biogenesis protein CcmF
LAGDYSIQYVQQNGHPAMPIFYKITAFWGSLDGSLLFWVLLLALFSSLAVRANRERHRPLIPHAVLVLSLILAFFCALLVFLKNPFTPFLLEMNVAPQGKGMNPLLQNPYMICHPPSLYLGMVSLAVPYAFGMAAMITGQVDSAWQRSVRRWVLFSWVFLSIGLVLGGLWAYEELGWGGYWAWDPVENAGLIPWLTCTAFLHSVMVQERRGMLKVWNLLLVITSFFLTIYGTFLTRSGVVQSVHAFGEDPILKWTFMGFMAVIVVVSLGLLIWRLPLLRSRNELESVLSREFAFLLNNWLFMIAAVFVAVATIYPTLHEALGNYAREHDGVRDLLFSVGLFDREEWMEALLQGTDPFARLMLGPSFYNHYLVPVGLALLLLTGIGPLLAWRKSSRSSLKQQFKWPLVAGALGIVLTGWLTPIIEWTRLSEALPAGYTSWEVLEARLAAITSPFGLACFGLCAFTACTIVQEFVRGVHVRRSNRKQPILEALIALVTKARRRYGGYVVHLGVVLMFFGWAGNAYKIERKLGVYPGETVQLGNYEVRHDGVRATQDWQKDMITVELSVLVDGEVVDELAPAKWWYFQSQDMPTTEVSRSMSLAGDIYASMDDVDMTTGWTRLNLYHNPLVNWVWAGFAIMLMGAAICIGTRREEGEGR